MTLILKATNKFRKLKWGYILDDSQIQTFHNCFPLLDVNKRPLKPPQENIHLKQGLENKPKTD